MHLFLTGEIQVGKSTVIKKVVKRLGVTPTGFRTVWGEADSEGQEHLHLLPFSIRSAKPKAPKSPASPATPARSSSPIVAVRRAGGRMLEKHPEIFDTAGVHLLSDEAKMRDSVLIVMDELGFLENDARLFQRCVLGLLDGPVPILGVIKPRQTTFLNRVRENKNVQVIEVTQENRTWIVYKALLHIQLEMASYQEQKEKEQKKKRRRK
ncbi:MAG: nucleoside-triphosphatase [Clostridiales Family XIII bacterium]|jgi:nucleoside-triphosphatase|nr:nucleoside-triphosphatase [Clostridiales Family XIII bacterium]